ncbi:efflux RND transporter periplasmic adaptor subunit [bacterium]|nr:MAG: efflux RND transporter periplasmic adaptor subunit [bacterium]
MKYFNLSALLLSLICIGCNTKNDMKEVEKPEESHSKIVTLTKAQYESVGIQLGGIELKNLREVVKANGYLKVPPQNQASISPLKGGIVKAIYIKVGDFVSAGQTLATLEHPDFIKMQEEYLTVKSNFTFLEKEYLRQKELNQENAGTVKIYQQTEANYRSERAKLTSLEKQLNMLFVSMDEISKGNMIAAVPIKSPIEGYVGRINANIGTFAQPEKPLFEVIDNRKIHVDIFVYEKDLFKVKVAQTVEFILTNQNNKLIQGAIFSISRAFENETKSVAVHAEIKNNNNLNLIHGMYVSALINVGEGKVSAVPQEAIVRTDGRDFIFVQTATTKEVSKKEDSSKEDKDEFSFEMTEVKTGITDLGFVEVTLLDQLPKDAKIAVKSTFFLLSKMKEGEGGDEH